MTCAHVRYSSNRHVVYTHVTCNPNRHPANTEQIDKTNPIQLFCAFDPKPQFDQSMVLTTYHVQLGCN